MDDPRDQTAPDQTDPESQAESPTRKPGRRRKAEGEAATRRAEPLLLEVAWEVCNQLGGIYTVLRSKVPSMVSAWGSRYILIGPYTQHASELEFEPAALTGPVGHVVKQLNDQGIGAHYGRWLVTGRPHVVLLNHLDIMPRLHEVKYRIWEEHDIALPGNDELLNNVVAFGEACRLFLELLARRESGRRDLIAHFHEWMAGIPIPMLRRRGWPGSTVFTTHATLLGRYLAMHDDDFYGHLPFYEPFTEAKHFNVDAQFRIERAAAHGSHVFTTVSDLTAAECRYLLGRNPDVLLPNGLNIQRFAAIHEFQNLHRLYKEKLHDFTIGHFYPSYSFDLDNTLYFFTSGRYEFRNKGFDLTIEALARLNHLMREAKTGTTVVMFFITRRPVKSINVAALSTNAMRSEFRSVTDAIRDQIGDRLFRAVAAGRIPDLNGLVDEYWLLRLRRMIHAWRRIMPPGIVTHDLADDTNDDMLNALRRCKLWNQQENPVKVIYHPDFITPSNPLFGLDYDQFVRGCHMGIFPSYYEPWGYTPLECVALGIPAITSDLSGFGSYLSQVLPDHGTRGLYIINRHQRNWYESADQLAHILFQFVQMNRRQRVDLRNAVEAFSEHFDWENLGKHYHEAHALALERMR
ncbi:MAG: glycogen/starch synthase [Phycisphaeraceae bacterium]|nr:glycogen/starch synthase [Phycisphaeraceae bacterium]